MCEAWIFPLSVMYVLDSRLGHPENKFSANVATQLPLDTPSQVLIKRALMRVFLTFMPQSNEKEKSCMIVDENCDYRYYHRIRRYSRSVTLVVSLIVLRPRKF